jgi:hypothetical protein
LIPNVSKRYFRASGGVWATDLHVSLREELPVVTRWLQANSAAGPGQISLQTLSHSRCAFIILDEKDIYQEQIDKLTHFRRYEVPNVRKLKRIVEFSCPIDSVRHPMIQLSDLVIFLSRKFLECENGYRPNWSAPLGQKQTLKRLQSMSALPPKADID